jgi:hypothetical protein
MVKLEPWLMGLRPLTKPVTPSGGRSDATEAFASGRDTNRSVSFVVSHNNALLPPGAFSRSVMSDLTIGEAA